MSVVKFIKCCITSGREIVVGSVLQQTLGEVQRKWTKIESYC